MIKTHTIVLAGCVGTILKGKTMIYHGTVTAGVIVLEGGVVLPEGTPVCVEPAAPAEQAALDRHKSGIPAVARDLERLSQGVQAAGLPVDLSISHDHYLHGAAKGIDQS